MRDPYTQAMTAGFEDELRKIAGLASAEAKAGKSLMGKLTHPAVLGAGGGILAYKTLSQAEQDRRMGRQIRKQNQGY